jgi:NADH-quinone oxidoreductase subunit A
MGQYLPVIALMVLAILFGAGSFLASGLLAPYRPNSAKEAPYECGIVPSRDNPERFPVSFYVIAMLFIMFDIEIIFTYPYALLHGELGVYGFVEMVSFSAVFFVAFVYMVARGALEWGPLQRRESVVDSASSDELIARNQAAAGVRVVGLEGRPGRGEAA